MKSIIANNTDAAGFADGSKTGFIVAVKPQPVYHDGVWRYKNYLHAADNFQHAFMEHAPYTIGQEVAVREAWGNHSYDNPETNAAYFEYFANYPQGAKEFEWPTPDEDGNKIICGLPKKRSAATMPLSAARTIIIPTYVKCVRVQDVCALKMGFKGTAIECVQQYYNYLISKFGQAAWDNNIYVFFYECKKK